jgi:hypothetical protein
MQMIILVPVTLRQRDKREESRKRREKIRKKRRAE